MWRFWAEKNQFQYQPKICQVDVVLGQNIEW